AYEGLVMEKVILWGILALFSGISFSSPSVFGQESEKAVDSEDEADGVGEDAESFSSQGRIRYTGFLLGPEVFSFCGGWVEIWAQAKYPWVDLKLKVSPPESVAWKVKPSDIEMELN